MSATRLWNSLPINLKEGKCVTSFRKALYSHFLTRYNDVDQWHLKVLIPTLTARGGTHLQSSCMYESRVEKDRIFCVC